MNRIALLIFMAVSGACHGGTRDPSVPDQRYIDYGSKHECVVPIYGDCNCDKDRPHQFSASAVVISPRWILTAAHVVKDKSSVKIRLKEDEISIKKVIANRHFDEDKLALYDIAIGESDRDMVLGFYPELYEDPDEGGKVASICGYGITGTFITGGRVSDGVRRAGSNVVRGINNHVLVCSATDRRKTNLEFMIAHGDSGGGLFIDQKLAGINSFVSAVDKNPNSSYGDECHHTRVSLFVPWIKGCMEGNEPEGKVDPTEEWSVE